LRASSSPDESEVGRRAFLALTLAPLASVFTVYAFLPLVLGPAVREQGWYKKNFASAMGGMGEYERGVSGMKKNLFALIRPGDSLVDLGAGLGPNIAYLPESLTYTAVEPNEYMHSAISEKAAAHFKDPSVILNDLRMVPTASADVVVSTLVLCSVKDQREVLAEVLRVLKNGGKFLFIEHVIEPSQGYPSPYKKDFDWGRAGYMWAQQATAPLQMALADGCRGDRDTVAVISEAFSEVFVKRFHAPQLWGAEDWWNYFPIGPQVAGVALKRPLKDPGQLAEVQFRFCAADHRLQQELAVKWEENAGPEEPSVSKIRCE